MDMRNVKGKKVVIGLEVRNMRYWRGRRSFEKLEERRSLRNWGCGWGEHGGSARGKRGEV